MEGFAFFPAIVYRDERPEFVEDLIPQTLKYLSEVTTIVHESIYQSRMLQYDPVFRSTSDYLLLTAVSILKEQGYATDCYDFYLSGLWAQEVRHGAGTNVHVHKNSQICGWMFLETPEDGAYPIYYDTRMHKSMIELDINQGDEITNATNVIHFDNVRPGTILFSNSWMQHQLVGGKTDKPTRCLHFIISHKDRLCNTC